MSNFIQALAKLQAGDLKLLVAQQAGPAGAEEKPLAPCGTTSSSSPTAKKRRRRRAKVGDDANPDAKDELSSPACVTTPLAPSEPVIPFAAAPAATAPDPLSDLSSQGFTLPAYTPSDKPEKVGKRRETGKQNKETAEAIAEEGVETSPSLPTSTGVEAPTPTPRLRRHIQHEWPAVGVRLTAIYHGQTYNAEIISAVKRLKSGKQVRLLDGPARGRIYDSLSEAMLAATEKQRRDQKRGRSGVSSGWLFWRWDGKANPGSP